MVEPPNVTPQQARRPWQFTLRGLFALTFSVALGLSFWKTEHDWYLGALAAISFWIVLGLAAQVRDLWGSLQRSSVLTTEERWGWRFAVAWRLAACCLIAAFFLVRWLVTWQVFAIIDRPDNLNLFVSSQEMCEAALLTVMIVAIASSPRFARKGRRHPWSRAVGLLGGIAGVVLFMILLVDRLFVHFIVHITIVGMQNAQPRQLSADTWAVWNPAQFAQFLGITTAGVVSVLVSCGLLRLLSLWWWRGRRGRTCLAVSLAASLTVLVLLASRIGLVEFPAIAPIFAANIFVPSPPQFVAAAVLTLLLVGVAARRWSEPPLAESAAAGRSWRRGETRYHHESQLLLLLLGGLALTQCVVTGIELVWQLGAYNPLGVTFAWLAVAYLVDSPVGCLSLALTILAGQGVFSGWSKRPDTVATDQPRLAPAYSCWFGRPY